MYTFATPARGFDRLRSVAETSSFMWMTFGRTPFEMAALAARAVAEPPERCASVLAILRILQNAVALGVFRAYSSSADAAIGRSLGSCSNG